MRRPGGNALWTVDGRVAREHDTTTCGHCSRIVTVEPGMRPEAQTPFRVIELERCRMCMRYICPACVWEAQRAVKACQPFEERLLRFESKSRLLEVAREEHAESRKPNERERLAAFMTETEVKRREIVTTAWDREQQRQREQHR